MASSNLFYLKLEGSAAGAEDLVLALLCVNSSNFSAREFVRVVACFRVDFSLQFRALGVIFGWFSVSFSAARFRKIPWGFSPFGASGFLRHCLFFPLSILKPCWRPWLVAPLNFLVSKGVDLSRAVCRKNTWGFSPFGAHGFLHRRIFWARRVEPAYVQHHDFSVG